MPTTRHCLLIVDDEPDVCDSVHDLLRREFRVLKANSAEEGYRIMQEEEVHIVMSDQRMPQITGVELLTKVKARHPQAIRMLFTGFADLESIIAAINQGHIYQFMKKPWQPEELIAAVRQAAVEFDRLERWPTRARAARSRKSTELKQRVSALETGGAAAPGGLMPARSRRARRGRAGLRSESGTPCAGSSRHPADIDASARQASRTVRYPDARSVRGGGATGWSKGGILSDR